MVKFLDQSILRKSDIVDDALSYSADGVPMPSVVEVSESGTCNRACAFCPRSDPNYPDVKEFIDSALIEKLSRQLAEIGFSGIFLFSGFVEPMLDTNIYRLISIIRNNLSRARIEMVTNGDVLNEQRLRRLFDNGLSTILISVYDGPEDAKRFENLCRTIGLEPDQFVIRHRYLPPEDDFGITLSNRSGLMKDAEFSIVGLSEPLQKPCHYPHYTFFMDYEGDVLICPHDWGKRYVAGNLKTQDFMDIWTGPELTAARQTLADGDRGISPCRVCDVEGTLMGRNHVKAWRKLGQIKNR